MQLKTAHIGAAVIVCLNVIGAPAAEIRGLTVKADVPLEPGRSLTLPLDRYWRSNLRLQGQKLEPDKKTYPHVPCLLEFRVEILKAGTYRLEAQADLAQAAPADFSADGTAVAEVFAAPLQPEAWTSLGQCRLSTGPHVLRLTARSVDTTFPTLSGLRLVWVDRQAPPAVRPEPIVAPRTTLPADWSEGISRKIHADFHTAGFIRNVGAGFDPDEYGQTLHDSHVNAICVFAKCHHGYTYYNTNVGTRHPGLSFDLLARQIEACRKRNIAIWAYFSLGYDELYTSTLDGVTVSKPDSRETKIDASPESHYVRDYIWPMIDEVTRRYDLDGLFFDFPGDERFVAQTIERIKRIKPGLAVAFNHQWGLSRAELRKLDVLEIEGWRHKQPLYHWQYFARYARGAVPLTAMTIRFWKSWQDFGGIADAAMLRYQVATGLANGCKLTIGDHPHPSGRLDPAVYQRIAGVFEEAEKLEPYVRGSQSVPYVALWRPEQVELVGADGPCAALVDSGIHFDVIDATQALAPYALVVVPDAAKLPADYEARLTDYVRSGGRLIALGQPSPRLAALLGVRITEKPEPAYVRFDRRRFESLPDTDLYTYLPLLAATPADDTVRYASVVWALNHGTIHGSKRQSPPELKASGFAAMTARKVDAGVAAWCGAPLLETYARMGYTPMRLAFRHLVETMLHRDQRLLDVQAPVPLEASLNRQGDRYVIHLVHAALSKPTAGSMAQDDYVNNDPIISGPVLVRGAYLRVAESLLGKRRFRLIRPQGGEIQVKPRNGYIRVDLPPFDTHVVLIAE